MMMLAHEVIGLYARQAPAMVILFTDDIYRGYIFDAGKAERHEYASRVERPPPL